MPWEKSFNVEESLEAAKILFWQNGYESTSMNDLLAAMGINRGSFYDTFGSKRDVLLAALRDYDAKNRAQALRAIARDKPPRDAILAIFATLIDASRTMQGQSGCLIVNSALELAPRDAEVAKIVQDAFADVQSLFQELLQQASEEGTLSAKLSPASIAVVLMNQIVGLMVLIRAGMDHATLQAVRQNIEHLLQ